MITVIYYTSNCEDTEFEKRIRETLWENKGDLPLVSVSQKPLDFGENICVGEVGRSSHNQWRQLQIGANVAKTDFVCLAESDFLYPKEHFQIEPTREDTFYAPLRVYQLCAMKGRINKFIPMHTRYREGTSIVSRKLLLETLDEILNGRDLWKAGIEPPEKMLKYLFDGRNVKLYRNPIPVVTFRTDNGMHQHIHDDHPSGINEIPFWGKASDLMRRYGLCET